MSIHLQLVQKALNFMVELPSKGCDIETQNMESLGLCAGVFSNDDCGLTPRSRKEKAKLS